MSTFVNSNKSIPPFSIYHDSHVRNKTNGCHRVVHLLVSYILAIETLAEEMKHVVLQKIQLECHDELFEYVVSGNFGLSGSYCKERSPMY